MTTFFVILPFWEATFSLFGNIHPFNHTSEHRVLLIQPIGFGCTQENLWAIGVRIGIGHLKSSSASVFQVNVFIVELRPIHTLVTSSITPGIVSTLTHESRDDTTEDASCKAETLFTSTQSTDIVCRFGCLVCPQLSFNSTSGLSANGYVKQLANRVTTLVLFIFVW